MADLPRPRTYLLVHGAWHGGWCWEPVAALLRAEGHRVFAPTLSGLEDARPASVADISLSTHVDDILTLVAAEQLQDFVLVGHSYGGLVISGVADRLRERVARCVYLDAAVPVRMAPGATLRWCDATTAQERAARLQAAQALGNGEVIPPPAASAFAVFNPAQAEWLARRLRPMPLQTYLGCFTFHSSGSDGLARTYIACTAPSYAPLQATHARIQADPSWRFMSLAAGHDAMLTEPQAVAALLRDIGCG